MKGVAGRRIRGAIAGGFVRIEGVWFWVLGERRGIQLGGRRDGYNLGFWSEARLKGDVDFG